MGHYFLDTQYIYGNSEYVGQVSSETEKLWTTTVDVNKKKYIYIS